MRKLSLMAKLLALLFVLFLAGLSLANFLPEDCVQCPSLLDARKLISYIETGDKPRPPCCPPDSRKFLTPTLQDTTVPIVGGYEVREIMTINKDSTLIIYQLIVEKIQRGDFVTQGKRSSKK